MISQISDEQIESLYSYGFAQYQSGVWGEAIDSFRILCTQRPFESKFWFALGASLQESGNYQDALYSWAMTALLKKEDPYPHFHAAECCLSLERKDEAKKALLESETRIKDDESSLKEKISILKNQWRI